jgi:hypothetical protein
MTSNAYGYLIRTLNEVKGEMADEAAVNRALLGSVIAASTGLSVGYVVWLIRGGMLLSTLLSSLPAWQILDPLPILARKAKVADDEDDESLESLVDGEPTPADTRPPSKTRPADPLPADESDER